MSIEGVFEGKVCYYREFIRFDIVDDIAALEGVLSPVGTTAILFVGHVEHRKLPFDDENVPLAHG